MTPLGDLHKARQTTCIIDNSGMVGGETIDNVVFFFLFFCFVFWSPSGHRSELLRILVIIRHPGVSIATKVINATVQNTSNRLMNIHCKCCTISCALCSSTCSVTVTLYMYLRHMFLVTYM